MRMTAIMGVLSLVACSSEEDPHTAAVEVVEAGATTALGDPLPGLAPDLLARFTAGKEEFETAEAPDEGLGPVFNGDSCVACHSVPAPGGSSTLVETRFGRVGPDGVFDPLANLGGSLIQTTGFGTVGGCTIVGETVPGIANVQAGRRTTPLFGLGLVDATPDGTFIVLAAAERLLPDGLAGKVSRVTNVETGNTAVGKFGWKCAVPTLHVFSGDAYVNEMGITSPFFPNDGCPQGDCSLLATCDPVLDPEDDGEDVGKFADFMGLLAPPPHPSLSLRGAAGAILFASLNCAGCHTPVLVTGSNAIPQLNRVTFFPFSDFLLHDMGSLGDGIVQGAAGAREMRTAPLWGVSRQPFFLHDGRATTLDAAILAHDGQGRKARDRFAALSAANRALVVQFLTEI
jgi:CxxC motif-containing protein (DUF1111 family)